VAISALEHRVVIRIRMARRTDAIRSAVIGREVSVIEGRPRPAGRCVAGLTGGREARRSMVRVGRALVISLMASVASGRQGRVVVVHVAEVAGHGGVRARQREGRVVVIEAGARPVGRAVADVASSREPDLGMIRVVRVVVVGLVTAHAGGVRAGQLVVTVHVTLLASDGQVETRERPTGGRVIKRAATPVRSAVALIAGSRESRLHVVWVGGAVVVGQVARDAGAAGELVIVVHVALRTLHGCVESGQRKAGSRVIESRIRPVGGAVAGLASCREAGRCVRRIVGAVVVGLVATDAGRIGAGQVVVAIDVTLLARHGGVEARERKAGGRVIKRTAAPVSGGMAVLASRREPSRHMWRVVGVIEIGLVTTDAGRVRTRQVVVTIDMALRALQRKVRTGQGEARGRVIEGCIAPRGRVVTILTSCRELRLHVARVVGVVKVGLVATHADSVRRGQLVVAIHVALHALHREVESSEGPACGRVIEGRVAPGRSVVAILTSRWELRLHVAWVIGVIEVGLVATDAGGIRAGQVVVAIDVALATEKRGVGARQRESRGGVIEARVAPIGGAVALFASLRHVRLHVIGLRSALVVVQVAGHAGRVRQVVVVIDVALRTLQRRVRTGQRETGAVMVESRIQPRSSGMTLFARLREALLRMIGIGRVLEVSQVTIDAGCIGARQTVVAVRVTERALQRRVRTGEWPPSGGVVKGRVRPRSRSVALLASLRHVGLHVVRLSGALEIFLVAADAHRVGAGQVVVIVDVAVRARGRHVGAR